MIAYEFIELWVCISLTKLVVAFENFDLEAFQQMCVVFILKY